VYPPSPEDAEVEFNFRGCIRRSALPAGSDSIVQARTAQDLFGQTLLCSSLVQSGDHYEIQLTKPSVFPIVLIHNGERLKTWCDSTAVKVVPEEARRLLGARLTLERDISEPGLVYRTSPKGTGSSKPKPKDTTRTRNLSANPMASPSLASKRASGPQKLDPRSKVGRDLVAPGPDFARASGCEITVILSQIQQIIRNVDLNRDASHEYIAQLIARQLHTEPVSPDYLELAPDDWFVNVRLIVRFRVDRPNLTS
jgi:hypothetical protein